MKEIPLSSGAVALVDDADFEWASRYRWHFDGKYARRTENKKDIRMHRDLMGVDGMVVDHINGNTLDNRRENLRVCTQAENMRNQRLRKTNSSGYKGVTWDKRKKKWMAKVGHSKTTLFAGYFNTPEEAARAYDEKATEIFGEYSKTNSNMLREEQKS